MYQEIDFLGISLVSVCLVDAKNVYYMLRQIYQPLSGLIAHSVINNGDLTFCKFIPHISILQHIKLDNTTVLLGMRMLYA